MSLIININIINPTLTNTYRFRIRTSGHQILNRIFNRNLSINIDVRGTNQFELTFEWFSNEEVLLNFSNGETPGNFEEQDIDFDSVVRYNSEPRSDSVSQRRSDTESPPTLSETLEHLEIARRFHSSYESDNESDYGRLQEP